MNRFGWVAFVALMTGVTGCDHASKQLASSELRSGAVPIVPNVLELRLTHNTDSAFSLLGGVLAPDVRWLLLSISTALVTLGALAFVALRWRKLTGLTRLGSALIIGGGLGNLSDRLGSGRVVDFIHIEHWPVFNVADVAITLGIGALLLGRGHCVDRGARPPLGSPS